MRLTASLLCLAVSAALATTVACAGGTSQQAAPAAAPAVVPTARNLVIITIDTLRADHVGAYGSSRARTPVLDRIAAAGVRFDRAYAAAPITLPSHATIMTGLYPPGHGARDNGQAVSPKVATLASTLKAAGFATGAFVGAFPLDHQFGLARGFDAYGDRLSRGRDGRQQNERPASQVADEAVAWLQSHQGNRFFLWVHFFEPHAPYGDVDSDTGTQRPAQDRYDDEIAIADRQAGRVVDALGPAASSTVVVVAGDHGEAFGEHGEVGHSIFIYDTTLRVPLLIHAPGLPPRLVDGPVTLADVAPTAARLLGLRMAETDGVDLGATLAGQPAPARELYAESFAPLVEFGWAPLRSIRQGDWKFIAAPKPELYHLASDVGEQREVAAANADLARRLEERASRFSPAALQAPTLALDRDTRARLGALGYTSSGGPVSGNSAARPDPKDRRELAARLAQVTSGELRGPALVAALEAIVRDDPRNGQAHLRLGYARIDANNCPAAEAEFDKAVAAGLVTADAYTGLATCRGRRNDLQGADEALSRARQLEPDNPAIVANIGILREARGDHAAAIEALQAALAKDPELHEARFNLALSYARAGRPDAARREADDLLRRLPANAPQRSEVERLRRAVSSPR